MLHCSDKWWNYVILAVISAMSYKCNESIATRPEKESSLNREVDNHNTCTHAHTQTHTDK